MHAAALLTADGRRSAGVSRAGPGAAALARKHWPGIARMVTLHFAFNVLDAGIEARSFVFVNDWHWSRLCVSELQPGSSRLVRRRSARARYVADDCLAAIADGHILHRDLLLAASSIALQRFHLSRERSQELVERTLRA